MSKGATTVTIFGDRIGTVSRYLKSPEPSAYNLRIPQASNMSLGYRIRWKWIVAGAFLSEVAILAIFFLLLLAAKLAGVPLLARPMSTLDYVDALVSSFGIVFLFALWVGKRV